MSEGSAFEQTEELLQIVPAKFSLARVEVLGGSEAGLYEAPIQLTLTVPSLLTLLVTIGLSQS